MLYTEFVAGGKEYKLRLNTRNIVILEKELGKNPLFIFTNKNNNNLPTVEEMVTVFYYALKHYHPDISLENAFDIVDEWLADNHIISEFTSVIVEIYKSAGIFKKTEENEKN